jgi:hypothetical protein
MNPTNDWKRSDILQLILAGLAGTFVMTLVLLPIASLARVPEFDFAAIVGSLFHRGDIARFSGVWWLGMLEHFFIGSVVFPLLFAFLVSKYLPGKIVSRAALWGLILFGVQQLVVLPLTGYGLFSAKTEFPIQQMLLSMPAHALYGIVFGLCLTDPARKALHKGENASLERAA